MIWSLREGAFLRVFVVLRGSVWSLRGVVLKGLWSLGHVVLRRWSLGVVLGVWSLGGVLLEGMALGGVVLRGMVFGGVEADTSPEAGNSCLN